MMNRNTPWYCAYTRPRYNSTIGYTRVIEKGSDMKNWLVVITSKVRPDLAIELPRLVAASGQPSKSAYIEWLIASHAELLRAAMGNREQGTAAVR